MLKPKDKEFSDDTKKELLRRARYRCQHCAARTHLTFHHKKKRSSQDEDLSCVDNGCVLCATCHTKADNPSTDKTRWEYSIFNTRSHQKIGELERAFLIWQHESGVKDWNPYYELSKGAVKNGDSDSKVEVPGDKNKTTGLPSV